MKGIATQTILLLLVGIVVVGILIFLVYRYAIGTSLSQEECRARAIAWCTLCKNSEWKSLTKVGKELAQCLNTYSPLPGTTIPEDADCRILGLQTTRREICGGYIPLD